MTETDFDRWLNGAYFYMISDFVVAVSLAETPFAESVACRWIAEEREPAQSAGWACYEWLPGYRRDDCFDSATIRSLLDPAVETIHTKPPTGRRAINHFVAAVGVSYLPLHRQAVAAAKKIGAIEGAKPGSCLVSASDRLQQAADKSRLGLKRKKLRY